MDMSSRRAFTLALSATFGVLSGVFVWGVFGRAGVVVGLLLVSFLIAAACEPLVDRLERRGVRRGVAAASLLTGIVIVLSAGVVAAGAAAWSQFADLRASLPQVVGDIERFVNDKFGVSIDFDWVVVEMGNANLTSLAGDLTPKVLGVVAGVLACLLITFYLIVDGRRIRRAICSLLPQQRQTEVLRVWDLAVAKTGGYVTAKTLLASMSSLVHATAFAVIGIPYAIPLGIWVGVVSQVIPIVGTYLALGFPIVVALTGSSPQAATMVVVVGVIYQQVENYVLTPRLTRNTMDLHPLVGFVGILVAASVFGPASTLLAAPILATLQGVVSAYVTRHEVLDDPRLHTGELPRSPRRQREQHRRT